MRLRIPITPEDQSFGRKIQNLRDIENNAVGSKINILESKLAKITGELSRLELPELAARIEALEKEFKELRNLGKDDKRGEAPKPAADVMDQLQKLSEKVEAFEGKMKQESEKTAKPQRKISRKRISKANFPFRQFQPERIRKPKRRRSMNLPKMISAL